MNWLMNSLTRWTRKQEEIYCNRLIGRIARHRSTIPILKLLQRR
jgi:hypothetical protein